MKNSSIFLIIGIIIIAIGLAWIISGGLAGPAAGTVPPAPAPTTVPAVPVTTAAVPVTTAPATTQATAVPTVTATSITTLTATTAALASADDIRDHFLDVAYLSTNRLERLNYDSSKPRVIISAISASDQDIVLIVKTAQDFNAASPTVKLSENVKETGTGDLFIKFLPADGLSVINLNDAPEAGPFTEDLTHRELYQGNVLAAKILRGTIYINADLKGDARKHVLVRSLMYEMGLTGESTKFTDSVFYAGENTNVDLSSADKKIINMLYSQGFYNDMTMEELRKVIYLP
jgi:Protein of unknown function (DUF2927)